MFRHTESTIANDVIKILLRNDLADGLPAIADWIESNLPGGLTVFFAPEHCHLRLRTSNMCESLNLRIKRRTRVDANQRCPTLER